jgi:type IV pilus assembly protein PilE
MIVLAIVMLLGGIGWNGYRHIIQKAGRSEGRALLQLLQEERAFLPAPLSRLPAGSGTGGFKWYSGVSPETSAYALSARACDGETLATCVLLKATPGAKASITAYGDADVAPSISTAGATAAPTAGLLVRPARAIGGMGAGSRSSS